MKIANLTTELCNEHESSNESRLPFIRAITIKINLSNNHEVFPNIFKPER